MSREKGLSLGKLSGTFYRPSVKRATYSVTDGITKNGKMDNE